MLIIEDLDLRAQFIKIRFKKWAQNAPNSLLLLVFAFYNKIIINSEQGTMFVIRV